MSELAKLSGTDMHQVLRRTPKYVRTLLEQNAGRAFLAGGYIRALIAGEPPSDIDIFGPDKATLEGWAKDIVVEASPVARLHETANAFTAIFSNGRKPLQFIYRWTYTDVERLVGEFDFTIARAAIWHDGIQWQSACDPRFYADLAARRLVYCAPKRSEDAGGSLMRVRKFLSRGYRIAPESLGACVARLMMGIRLDANSLPLDEPWLAKMLTGLLREVDPLTIIDGIEPIDETN